MSDTATIPVFAAAAPRPAAGRAEAAIARAAERTGADFSYLLAQARLESSLDPQAKARTSSAAGLYQFIDSTWLETLDRHGSQFGLDGLAGAIDKAGGRARIADPAMRGEIMALRYDPDTSALMAGALAEDNRAALAPVLGREPDASELYLAHFLGIGGATQFLTALGQDPGASAAALLPKAASANRSIFFAAGGTPRSLGDVMTLVRDKMAGAMDGAGALAPVASSPATRFAAAQAQWRSSAGQSALAPTALPLADPVARPSMAETLRTSFALADGPGAASRGGAGDHVRTAYDKLRTFGL